jgi:hypothetical protein
MSFPTITKRQRKTVHASRMASLFAKQVAKRIEASLKEKVTR